MSHGTSRISECRDDNRTKRVAGNGYSFGNAGTFAPNKHRPVHRWYPYIEGFSAEFVSALLEEFGSAAARIHDPFVGAGTALVASLTGRAVTYCEINPFLQLVAESKTNTARMARRADQGGGGLSRRGCRVGAQGVTHGGGSFWGTGGRFRRPSLLRGPEVAGNRGATSGDSQSARGRLFDVWDKDTFLYSFPYQIYNHWAYEELVSLGEAAVPYMLGELQRGNPDIVRALRSISGESLVQGMGLTTEDIMETWLAWGKAKGYVPTVA